MNPLNIPVGLSDFLEIQENNYYYIDKSGLIAELLRTSIAEVTLITRPRRFGKTLAMSMLSYFFDIRKDTKACFDQLEISNYPDICASWQNQWPTIFISFRRVDGLDFKSASGMLSMVISDLYCEYLYLLDSPDIHDYDKLNFKKIASGNASDLEIKNSLLLLTRMLSNHYHKSVILLIDEYDVPLSKASSHGYYDEMLDLMKNLLQVLKDNTHLRFSVITGCLKIAKESIFTGTNNFVSDTITSSKLNEYFGFTQSDVTQLLKDADFSDHADIIKFWYNGYHFGDYDIYCPWDVMNYLRDLQFNPSAKPVSYWKNTSDNAIIRSFIDYAGGSITQKLETLLSGNYILQKINEDLTYDYLHSSEDNLWSILYLTGYLTQLRKTDLNISLSDDISALIIPNAEIREIYESTIITWFDDNVKNWHRNALFDAVWHSDTEKISSEMTKLLRKTISYHDYKEDFYHAFLAGIFTGAGYIVESNKEHGEGRSDIVIKDASEGRIAIFEVKYSKSSENLAIDCDRALTQIDKKMYAKEYEDNYDYIFCYGISFFKKRCLVKMK